MKYPGSFHEFLSSIIAILEKESAMSLTHVLLDLPVLRDSSVGSEESWLGSPFLLCPLQAE